MPKAEQSTVGAPELPAAPQLDAVSAACHAAARVDGQ